MTRHQLSTLVSNYLPTTSPATSGRLHELCWHATHDPRRWLISPITRWCMCRRCVGCSALWGGRHRFRGGHSACHAMCDIGPRLFVLIPDCGAAGALGHNNHGTHTSRSERYKTPHTCFWSGLPPHTQYQHLRRAAHRSITMFAHATTHLDCAGLSRRRCYCCADAVANPCIIAQSGRTTAIRSRCKRKAPAIINSRFGCGYVLQQTNQLAIVRSGGVPHNSLTLNTHRKITLARVSGVV